MGCTVGRPPGGLTAGRGRGVLGLGGLRACEGVRGRVRACEGVFYPDPKGKHHVKTYKSEVLMHDKQYFILKGNKYPK